jgi:hypothetical protein
MIVAVTPVGIDQEISVKQTLQIKSQIEGAVAGFSVPSHLNGPFISGPLLFYILLLL